MTFEDTVRRLGGQAQTAGAIRGQWFNIRVCPKVATGELLNIGVGFVDAGGQVFTRLATDYGRLTCFYDDRVDVDSFGRLAAIIQSELNGSAGALGRLGEMSPMLSASDLKAASGNSVQEILDNLFEATVTVGQPRHERAPLRERGISTDQLREVVRQDLRARLGTKVEPFIPRRPVTVGRDHGQRRQVSLTFRKEGRLAASVVSVWSREDMRRKVTLFEAALDLDVVFKHSQDERLGLFIARPTSLEHEFTTGELGQIDKEVDEVAWRLRQLAPKQARIEVASSPLEIAQHVEHWIFQKAA